MKNQALYKSISKKFNDLNKIVSQIEKIEDFSKQLKENNQLLKTEKDTEMKELIIDEIKCFEK